MIGARLRCSYCRGEGFLTKPCPLCGAMRERPTGDIVRVDSLWGGVRATAGAEAIEGPEAVSA